MSCVVSLCSRFYGALDCASRLWTPRLMMTMSSMSDSLVASDPSKSAFLEFGHGYPGHQQHSPGLSHNHYPVHGLHPVGPSQHDSPFSSSASSYGRPLGYPYHSTVSAHHPGSYLPYQHSNHNHALGNNRIEETGTFQSVEILVLRCSVVFLV